MSQWQSIETAPKDMQILLFGSQTKHDSGVRFKGDFVFSGYWDDIDSAWCSTGSTERGPWFNPSHWMPLPLGPREN